MLPQFLKAVAVATGGRVRGNLEQLSDLLEGVIVPDLQDNGLALFTGQASQALHRLEFARTFGGTGLEPTPGLPLAGQPPPQAAPMVQDAVAKAAYAVMLRQGRGLRTPHERKKRLLQDVFGLAMAEPQRPPVKDQFGRFGVIEGLAPSGFLATIHSCSIYLIDIKSEPFV